MKIKLAAMQKIWLCFIGLYLDKSSLTAMANLHISIFSAFKWRFAGDGPLIVVFGIWIPSSNKKKTLKKRCQMWTPSDKTFWTCACQDDHVNKKATPRLTLCLLVNFRHSFCRLLIFFKIIFCGKCFQKYHQSVKQL